MARARFVPDFGGYSDFLASDGIQSLLDDVADGIQEDATSSLSSDWGDPPIDDHFESGSFTTRVGVQGRYVKTLTEHAVRSEAKNKTLTKALLRAKV